jgi:poly(A) polymerase
MRTVAEALANLQRTSETPLLGKLGRLFNAAGFELALVGGPVRDAFLGRPTNDLDFTTSANPDQILQVLKGQVDAQWDVGREYGTIGARIGDDTIEITTYRADSYDPDSRKPVVAFGDNLEGDLFRRDFTVNSMALRLPDGVFVDPFNGLSDLIDGVIRTPGKPEDSFSDDPLRIMRAARFASQLGFMVHEDTFKAMKDMADRIEIVSAERIQVEISKLILGAHPREGLEVLVDSGIAEIVFPELPSLKLEID